MTITLGSPQFARKLKTFYTPARRYSAHEDHLIRARQMLSLLIIYNFERHQFGLVGLQSRWVWVVEG